MKGVWDFKVGRSKTAMETKQFFKAVWDLKPVRVHVGSHINVLLEKSSQLLMIKTLKNRENKEKLPHFILDRYWKAFLKTFHFHFIRVLFPAAIDRAHFAGNKSTRIFSEVKLPVHTHDLLLPVLKTKTRLEQGLAEYQFLNKQC